MVRQVPRVLEMCVDLAPGCCCFVVQQQRYCARQECDGRWFDVVHGLVCHHPVVQSLVHGHVASSLMQYGTMLVCIAGGGCVHCLPGTVGGGQ